jgi:3',5'-cyclic AMP phosphodiesterase CpdA
VRSTGTIGACGLALALSATLAAQQARPVAAASPVLVGAGDIAACNEDGDEKTARLLDGIEGTVFTLGDNAYPNGTVQEFAKCYEPAWGRHKKRTRPLPGNHDYRTAGAAPYFAYFGANAGDPKTGYYSYDLGAWHIVVLNSNCGEIDGCHAGSTQEQWLRKDLAAHHTPCVGAMWHHPRYSSSSEHGDDTDVSDLWRALQDGGADWVLSGHDHTYERFAPQDADGKADPARGIRQFVVGTGGKSHYEFGTIRPNSEVHDNTAFGVLKLTLHPGSYGWEFVPVEGEKFTDKGSARCR